MPTIDELRKIRLEKLKKLENAGISAYPSKTKRTHTCEQALDDFLKIVKSEKEIIIVGRIKSLREHGELCFADIEDGTEKIQAFFMKNKLGENSYNLFLKIFDIGDFIEIRGILFETKRGEKTIEAADFKMLAKSLLPLPEKWHGLQDTEERYRKRYLDILFNPETKEMIKKKAIFWNSIRQFLTIRGFLEVETPILETSTGGADARPFVTHHNALDMDVYLRISAGELWQKRLMIAGFEKTFEIGRQFRNEGMDAEHLQDYTQMEFYWAYADYKDCMKLAEDLFKDVSQKTFGTLKFKMGEFEVDLGKEWERYDYKSTIHKHTKLDILSANLKAIEEKLKELKITYEKKGLNKARAIDYLWKYCRKQIAGPGFLINEPALVSPLAKRIEGQPELTERFHIILAGSELANGYSELNDPIDQRQRFEDQQKLREAGDEEAQMNDKDFIEALEHGMPPTTGFGMSERLFSFLIDKPIRECQIFPLMRPKGN